MDAAFDLFPSNAYLSDFLAFKAVLDTKLHDSPFFESQWYNRHYKGQNKMPSSGQVGGFFVFKKYLKEKIMGQLKHFTFYDLYWQLVKNVNNVTVGRIIKNICAYEFCGEQPTQIADDMESFVWSNIEDALARVKQLETAGKTPKSYNKKMSHFSFLDAYYKALKLMNDEDCGAYLKALCGYMFDGKEPAKLKPPVDMYFDLAKTKLVLSKVRIISGSKGGKTEKVKVTDDQIAEATNRNNQGITFDEFIRLHPNIQNDLYSSRLHLLDKVDWGYLDIGLDNCKEYKNCTSLYAILMHYKEIVSYAKW